MSGCTLPSGSGPASAPHDAAHAEKLFPDVHGLSYDAASDTLWVATHAGLKRRVGEGAWEDVGPKQDLMGFSRDPVQPGTFWGSGHPSTGGNLGAIRSTDGGATWTAVGAPGADFHAMIATGDALYGSFRGAIHRSTDGGASWEQVSLVGVASFARANERLFAATVADLRASDDRGESWRVLSAVPAYGVAAASEEVLYAGVEGALFASRDGGRTWSETTLPARAGVVGHVHVDPAAPSVVHAASYDGFVWRSDDAGATWSSVART